MKTRENNHFKSPLTDLIDDESYDRFDHRKSALYYGQYWGADKQAFIRKRARKRKIRDIEQNKPGWGLKERALQGAAKSLFLEYGGKPPCVGCARANVGVRSWTPISPTLEVPQDLGVLKYEGNPVEAAKIVKQAAKFFGAFRTGITGLDRRHVFEVDCDGKKIVFETAEEPYETEEKRVIPEKCKYVVVMLLYMGEEGLACAPAPIGSMVPLWTYKRIDLLTGAVAEFIRGLGYTAIPSANDTAVNGPIANEAGLGEQGRADKLINPEVGALVRICKVFTDLPMALDQPREYGIAEFCKVCRICVETCPVNTIDKEREPSFEVPGRVSRVLKYQDHGAIPVTKPGMAIIQGVGPMRNTPKGVAVYACTCAHGTSPKEGSIPS
jgi:reductive dehalogenase